MIAAILRFRVHQMFLAAGVAIAWFGLYQGLNFLLCLALLVCIGLVPGWAIEGGAARIARKRLRAAAPHYEQAAAFREQGEYDMAVVEYGKVIGIDPNNARAYTGRGNVYDLKGEYDLAIADYTAAIGIDPRIRGLAHQKTIGRTAGDYDLAWAYYYRGCSYQSKGEPDLAKSDFEAAVSVGHVGFPEALAYNELTTVQHEKSEDPRTVHYVKPCGAVRRTGRLNFLYSRYYLGVNCDECLENRPLTKSAQGTTSRARSPAGEKAFWVILVVMSPLFAWVALMHLKDGEVTTGLTMAALSTILLLPFWGGLFQMTVLKITKPLASKILAKPFEGIR